MVKVVVVKGSPKFGKVEQSERYYAEIVEFLNNKGCTVELIDMRDLVSVIPAELYVVHGRACQLASDPRIIEVSRGLLQFGGLDGITHPIDRAWQEGARQGLPPDEHFIFLDEQKEALGRMIEGILDKDKAISGIETLAVSQERRQVRRQNVSGFQVRRS